MTRPRILAIDDEEAFLDSIERVLRDHYDITKATTGAKGLALLKSEKFNAVLLDINLPDSNGLDLLKEFVDFNPLLPVLMLTGESKSDLVVQAIKTGAYDYLTKLLDRDRLITSVGNAIKWEASERDRAALLKSAGAEFPFIGKSMQFEELIAKISKVAPSDLPVLITGETGVGKDIVARRLHLQSKRAAYPFVKINIPAIQDTLLESELFGHIKGAFTGANWDSPGLIETANGGTIFLDEIGLASLAIQSKLLQVVEHGIFRRVGGTADVKVDVRFVSATNKDLEREIKEQTFLEDLYSRISGFEINVPPLRERRIDIPGLLVHYMMKSSARTGVPCKEISPGALSMLLDYSWPRNVRELIAFVERVMLLVGHDTILPDDVTMYLGKSAAGPPAVAPTGLEEALSVRERELIQAALIMNSFNVTKAAESLKIHRSTLYEKMKSLQINVVEPS